MNIAIPPSIDNTAKPASEEQYADILKAYEQLERHKYGDAIGHLLAHRNEVSINTDPRYANAWRSSDGERLYATESWDLNEDSVATKIRGDGPDEMPVKLQLIEVPERRTHYYVGADFYDVQVNVVRDMYREMPAGRKNWLARFVIEHAESDLQRVAATMLASDLSRDVGINILALCHGDLFATDLPPTPEIRAREFNAVPDPDAPYLLTVTDEDDEDDEELAEIVAWVRSATHGDLLRGHRESIGARLVRDREVLADLPPVPFDACDRQATRVSSLSLVR